MKRRTNKSHRVPNVKLRPGEPQPSNALVAHESSFWPDDSQLRSDDTTFRDTCPRPFRNVVLCATGISDKPALFKMACELGASTISAFTDKVTHLIATTHGGPKYKCALEHNVPIVRPSWIIENYEVWLHGDDVEMDLERSITGHRLPIFSDVVVCLSGISDVERRVSIRRIVEQEGGSYVKAIERPVRVTHLLCSGDEETDKMRYADKFVNRGEAQIYMVWEDWFWDSLKMKGRLDEARYNVRNPRPPPVELRNTQPNVPDSTVPSRSNSMQAPAPAPAPEVDDLDDEAACVKIVPDITLKVWTGLLERRGYEVEGGEIIRSPPKKSQAKSRSLTPPPERRGAKRTGVISAVRSTNTFEVVEKEGSTSRPAPFKRTSTSTSIPVPNEADNQAGPSKQRLTPSMPPLPEIFTGVRFFLVGEADAAPVRSAIEQSGGSVVNEKAEADFYLVRLISGSQMYRGETGIESRDKYRTECWLERCIHEERVCAVDEHVSFKPLDVDLPIPGASAVLIGLSGLDQSESCHTRRLLKAFGANLIPLFSRKATHLLCPSGVGLKSDKAREWGIPVVSNEWLAAIASTGVIPGPDEYTVGAQADAKGKGRAFEAPKSAKPSQDKGKGRVDAMDVDNKMHDITNNPMDPSASLGKPGNLDREPTTIIPDGSTGVPSGFGQPTEMLGSLVAASSGASSSFYVHPSSLRAQTESSMAHSLRESLGQQQQLPSPQSSGAARSLRPTKSRKLTSEGTASSTSRASAMPSSGGSTEDEEDEHQQQHHIPSDDRDRMRVPSSASPSPMKGPGMRSSVSPAKSDVRAGAMLALQESVASLLGKRTSPEDEEEGGGVLPAAESVGESESARGAGGKRKRAQRGKGGSRGKAAAVKRRSPVGVREDDVGISLSAFELYGGSGALPQPGDVGGVEEQSLRVVFEDPAQLEERQRLMSLLKTNGNGAAGSKKDLGGVKAEGGGSMEEIESGTLSGRSTRSASARVTRRSGRVSGAS
ncbi:hypothetical protein DFP72DRAFT_892416 [Ephemerocybe angulata]|uniref:BRCT domain-containing protein n=1 Tax=Ephemerocybe angulata TaxID=980116 RepID=A0A8H6I0T4_9AGAR|nr:hypothetical protein DFP72DRAFT_892416 [Tulosesus angulatus]